MTGLRYTAAGPFLQASAVAAHDLGVGEGVTDRVDDRGQHRIGESSEPVVNPQALAACFDEPGLPEVGQVTGDL